MKFLMFQISKMKIYTSLFDQYLMLLSDRQKIIKTMNSDFKNEKKYDFNNCKSDNNMQLKKVVKSNNFDNFNDFNDESNSNNDENKNENVDENEILSSSSSNSLISKITFTSTFTSINSTVLTVKDRQKRTQKPAIIILIIEDK